jgi:hypothetical protein
MRLRNLFGSFFFVSFLALNSQNVLAENDSKRCSVPAEKSDPQWLIKKITKNCTPGDVLYFGSMKKPARIASYVCDFSKEILYSNATGDFACVYKAVRQKR